MQVFLTLVVGVVCSVYVTFVVWDHRWVTLIYVVNVVADVLVCVDIYVGLIPHISAWSYQMLVFGNHTLV